MAAPSVSVTTLASPTGFAGVLQAGGSGPIGESRWYRLIAMDATTAATVRRHSVPAAEIGPFVFDATNRKVALSWDTVAGAAAYRVYVRTSANPNPLYLETVPNMPGSALSTFHQTTGLTFTDQAASFTAKRAFWERGIVRAVCTGGDGAGPVGTAHDVYNAIAAASPANAWKLFPDLVSRAVKSANYGLAAYLEIGDAVTPTTWELLDTTLMIVGGFIARNGGPVVLRLGQYDAANGKRSRGSSIYCLGYGGAAGRLSFNSDTLEIVDSFIEDMCMLGVDAANYVGQGASLTPDTGHKIGSVTPDLPAVARAAEFKGLGAAAALNVQEQFSVIDQSFWRSCDAALSTGTGAVTFTGIVAEDQKYGYQAVVSGIQLRLTDLIIRDVSDADFHLGLGSGAFNSKLILRDAIFGDRSDQLDPVVRFHQLTSTGGVIAFEQGFEAINVESLDGTAIQGALVEAVATDGTVLASAVTDAAGKVAATFWEFLAFTCNVAGAALPAALSAHVTAGKLSKVDRRPVVLRISKAGYQTVREHHVQTGTLTEARVVLPLEVEAAATVEASQEEAACAVSDLTLALTVADDSPAAVVSVDQVAA